MADPPDREPQDSHPDEAEGPPTAAFNKKMLGFFSSAAPTGDANPSLADLESELARELGIGQPPPSNAVPAPPAAAPSAPLPVQAPLPPTRSGLQAAPLPQVASGAAASRRVWPLVVGLLVLLVGGGLGVFFLNK
jgi:hypothetical protein